MSTPAIKKALTTVSTTIDGVTAAAETIWPAAGNPISSVLKYFPEDL